MNPCRKDGSPIRVIRLPDGSLYVDPLRGEGHRGGPFAPRHYHRFEDYGLEPPVRRCKKCGLLAPLEETSPYENPDNLDGQHEAPEAL